MGGLVNAYSERDAAKLKAFMEGAASGGDKWLDAAPSAPVGAPAAPKGPTDAPPVGAITYGYQQGKATLGVGAHNVIMGLNNILTGGGDPNQARGHVKGAAQIIEGLFQMGLSPVVGASGALGDTLDKIAPSLARANVLGSGQIPGVIRTMLNPFGSIASMLESPESISKMTDAQLAEYQAKAAGLNASFTFREAAELAASVAIPIAIANKILPGKGAKTEAEGGVKPSAAEQPIAEPSTTTAQTLTPEEAQSFVDQVKAASAEPSVQTVEPVKPLQINWDEIGTRASIDRALARANKNRDPESFNVTLDRLTSETDLGAMQNIKDTLDKHVDTAISKSKGFNDPDVNAALALSRLAKDRVEQLSGRSADPVLTPEEVEIAITTMNNAQPSETTTAMIQRLKETQGTKSAEGWGDKFWESSKRGVCAGWEYWIGSMLSSPRTWAKKAMSDTGMILSALPQRALMRMNHVLLFADDMNGTQAGEALALAHGYKEAVGNIIGMIANRDNIASLPGVDLAISKRGDIYQRSWGEPAITGEQLGVDRVPVLGGAVDVTGSLIRIGPNMLKNITRVAQSVNFTGESAAQVVRQAHLEAADLIGKPGYSEKVAERMSYIKDNVQEYPEIEKAAIQASNYNTFMRPLGPSGEAFVKWMNLTPTMRTNMPFYLVPINFGKEAAYLFPPTWMASRIWGEMGRKWNLGGTAREEALAKLEMGSLITGSLAMLATSGRTTGAGPTDPGLREAWQNTGRNPYMIYDQAIQPGAKGVSLHSIAPWGLVAGAVADIAEVWGQIPSGSKMADSAMNIAAALTLGVVKSAENESMLQGWTRFLNAINNPQQELGVYLKGMAGSLIPNVWKDIQKTFLDQTVKEVRTPLDRLRADIWRPGAVDRKDHITGDPILYPPGLGPDIVSPFTLSEIKPDIVAHELWDNQIRVERFPWVVAGTRNPAEFLQLAPTSPYEGIPITGEQRDRWIDIATKEIHVNGLNLHDMLERTIMRPKYQTLPTGPESPARQSELDPIMARYRDMARLRLLKEDPDLRIQAQIHERERLQNQLPVTNPKSIGVIRPGTFNVGGVPQ